MRTLIQIAALALLTGCSTLSFRVGQDEVRPPVHELITEDVRQGADWLAREVQEGPAHEVALALTQRVGAPNRRVIDAERVQSNLAAGQRHYRAQLERLNRWLERRAGTPLEGTGINLVGVGGVLLLVGVVALCILVPALIPLFISIVRALTGAGYSTLKHTSKGIVKSIEAYKARKPEEANELLGEIGKNLDERDKILIEKLKRQ